VEGNGGLRKRPSWLSRLAVRMKKELEKHIHVNNGIKMEGGEAPFYERHAISQGNRKGKISGLFREGFEFGVKSCFESERG